MKVICGKPALGLSLDDVFALLKEGKISIHALEARHLHRFGDLVHYIKGKDGSLEPTDILIVAWSMADKACRGFLTFEVKLIQSRGLEQTIKNKVADRRYTITDDPHL